MLNVCMHGPMKLDGSRLVCEWHSAVFGGGDGRCLEGQQALIAD
ncbi:MAG: Rieske 2Fe-2S domain-containing protein [Acidobacteria bacterium]|nr:Rieske 2Fe-2S domain-containing protein [Acidobacteriota bacterium]